MNLYNIFQIVRMFLRKDVRAFYRKIQRTYREDPNYSLINTAKYLLTMIKGEKIVKFEDKYVITSFYPAVPSTAFLQLATATPKKENIYSQQMYAERSGPVSFFLALTYKCNYNCKHCSAKGRKIGEELTTKQWKDTIKSIQDMGTSVIGFTGGEPLMMEDLDEIIAAVDERSTTILYTNGKGLSFEKASSLKEAGLFSVGISLDTPDKEKFNSFRGSESAFKNSIKALENSRRAGLYTMLQAFIMKEDVNKKNLMQLMKLGKDLKIHEVRILEPIRSGHLFEPKNMENAFFDKETRLQLIKFQKRINRKFSYPKLTTFAHFESDQKFGCGAGTQHSYITPLGELLPCDFVPLSFGNILEEDIKDLWLEMNKTIGIPKSGCFANRINKELQKYKDNIFPLEKSISKEVCSKHQATSFPKFFQIWQG